MYDIKLYLNTGFDAVNIPSKPSVLQSFRSIDFDDVNIIQSLYLSYIKLKIDYDVAQQVDYVEIIGDIKSKYYTVSKIEMVSPTTCKFYLLIDAYNSIGGLIDKNEIITCTANRCHVKQKYTATGALDEGLFNLPEPFKCNEALIFHSSYFKMGESDSYSDLSICEMVIFPPDADTSYTPDPYASSGIQIQGSNAQIKGKAHSYGDRVAKYQNDVNIPDGTASITEYITESTEVIKCVTPAPSLVKLNLGTQSILLNGLYFTYRNFRNATIKDYITILRAIGAESGVIGAYIIPEIWCEPVNLDSTQPTAQTQINNKYYQSLPSAPTQVISINGSFCSKKIYNPKAVNTSGINKMLVYSSASGSCIELDPSIFETRDQETINPEASEQQYIYSDGYLVKKIIQPYFVAYSDPRKDGTPILKIINRYGTSFTSGLKGDIADGAMTVKGAQWDDQAIVYEGMSGYVMAQKTQNASNKAENNASIGQAVLGGLGIIAGGVALATGVGAGLGVGLITAGVGGLTSGVMSYVANSKEQQEQQNLLNQKSEFTYNPINIETNNTLRDVSRNTFRVGWYCMQQYDLIQYDRFLTKYGYNVGNYTIDKTYFSNRVAFNYIRVNDIQIKSTEPMYMIKLVQEQLKAGVRLWHLPPSESYYEPANNLCRQ